MHAFVCTLFIRGRIQKFRWGRLGPKAPSLDAFGVESETLKASRGVANGEGVSSLHLTLVSGGSS